MESPIWRRRMKDYDCLILVGLATQQAKNQDLHNGVEPRLYEFFDFSFAVAQDRLTPLPPSSFASASRNARSFANVVGFGCRSRVRKSKSVACVTPMRPAIFSAIRSFSQSIRGNLAALFLGPAHSLNKERV